MKTSLSPEDNLVNRINTLLACKANHSEGITMLTSKQDDILKTDISFKIDWKTLNKLWVDPKNAIKRKWYVNTFSLSRRRVFRETWINDMNRINSFFAS